MTDSRPIRKLAAVFEDDHLFKRTREGNQEFCTSLLYVRAHICLDMCVPMLSRINNGRKERVKWSFSCPVWPWHRKRLECLRMCACVCLGMTPKEIRKLDIYPMRTLFCPLLAHTVAKLIKSNQNIYLKHFQELLPHSTVASSRHGDISHLSNSQCREREGPSGDCWAGYMKIKKK